MNNKFIGFAVAVALVVIPNIVSAHSHPISCEVPVVASHGGLLYGSGPMAVGWNPALHPNYVQYNGTTCPFQQGCMLPQ